MNDAVYVYDLTYQFIHDAVRINTNLPDIVFAYFCHYLTNTRQL